MRFCEMGNPSHTPSAIVYWIQSTSSRLRYTSLINTSSLHFLASMRRPVTSVLMISDAKQCNVLGKLDVLEAFIMISPQYHHNTTTIPPQYHVIHFWHYVFVTKHQLLWCNELIVITPLTIRINSYIRIISYIIIIVITIW